jgi:hypothetical protein
MVLVIDLAALRRDCLHPDETCHIRGVGEVPIEVARRWVDDAFIKVVIRDGDDVRLVSHLGSHINATLRTALDLVEPVCAVPRCDHGRLEYHHLDPRRNDGPTCRDNLSRVCTRCHRLITNQGYVLAGTPGHRMWINPEGIVERSDDPALVGQPPPCAPAADTDGDPRAADPDNVIDLDQIDSVEAFNQLILLREPARAP